MHALSLKLSFVVVEVLDPGCDVPPTRRPDFYFCFFRVAACAFRCRSTLSSICRSIPSINLSINLCLTPCQSILSINLCLTTAPNPKQILQFSGVPTTQSQPKSRCLHPMISRSKEIVHDVSEPPLPILCFFVFSCCCLCLSLPIYPVINLSINPVDQSVDQSVSNTLSINPVDQSVSNNQLAVDLPCRSILLPNQPSVL